MVDKLKVMFGSVRFWYALATAVCFSLSEFGIISTELFVGIASFTGYGIVVRTVDRFNK